MPDAATRACVLGLSILVVSGWAMQAAAPEDPTEPAQVLEPLEIGFTESTETALLFLDVAAIDGSGRPMPGLVKADFKLRLDRLPRPIYSVDDLCPCNAETGEVDPDPWDDPERLKLVLQTIRPRYSLFFDFSQLQRDGKAQALAAAERWVRDVMVEDDLVQMAAHSEARGLQRLTPFTSDKQILLTALADAGRDPDYDDAFPSDIWDRRERCASAGAGRALVRERFEARARESVAPPLRPTTGLAFPDGGDVACSYFARQEYFRIDRSLLNLRYYAGQLDQYPERKAILFFHQNATAFPGRLYSFSSDGVGALMLDGRPSESVSDLARLTEQVSGTATLARASIFPVVTGYGETWSVNLGANLADATGGRHNLGAATADAILDSAGRGCGCYYRIGLRAPRRSSHVYHVKVIARGHKLPSRYRLQFLTEEDRWMQTAEAVLAAAGDDETVDVAAALLPVVTDARWGLAVQVAVDAATLALDPDIQPDVGDGRLVSEWEAGALLFSTETGEEWELLNASRIRRTTDSEGPTVVLHERTFDGLSPGDYELRAFVHDRIADVWGSVRANVRVPVPGEPWVAGPLLLRPDAGYLQSDLPTRKKKRKARGPAVTEGRTGAVPVGDVVPGALPLQVSSWICTADQAQPTVRRTLLLDGVAYEHPASFEWVPRGSCFEAREQFAPGDLPPGAYSYRVDFDGADASVLETEKTFEVAPPATVTPPAGQ